MIFKEKSMERFFSIVIKNLNGGDIK